MSAIEHTLRVSFRHRVFFTRDVFGLGNGLLRQILESSGPSRGRVLVVVDESLSAAQPELIGKIIAYFGADRSAAELVSEPMLLEGGERVKNGYFHVSQIQSRMDRDHVDRHSYVVAAGGGAVLDVVGLAAATAHRGVRHVRLPSTTLSQADAGVGVKNSINAFGKKNFIGTFAVPFAVVNDFELLASLPARDRRGGYAEAVKVALLRDGVFFDWLEGVAGKLREFDAETMQRLIYRCAELHLEHIAQSGDPFELGSSRPLDFGHWAAHKLEQLSDYQIRHGEAVAMGVALDTVYSRKMRLLDATSAGRVLQLLAALGFELFAHELLNVDSGGGLLVLRGLEEFREHLGGQLSVTMLAGIGRGCEVHEIDLGVMAEAIRELAARAEAKRGEP